MSSTKSNKKTPSWRFRLQITFKRIEIFDFIDFWLLTIDCFRACVSRYFMLLLCQWLPWSKRKKLLKSMAEKRTIRALQRSKSRFLQKKLAILLFILRKIGKISTPEGGFFKWLLTDWHICNILRKKVLADTTLLLKALDWKNKNPHLSSKPYFCSITMGQFVLNQLWSYTYQCSQEVLLQIFIHNRS